MPQAANGLAAVFCCIQTCASSRSAAKPESHVTVVGAVALGSVAGVAAKTGRPVEKPPPLYPAGWFPLAVPVQTVFVPSLWPTSTPAISVACAVPSYRRKL